MMVTCGSALSMRHESIDLPLHRLAEERLHPAQIAESFLADVGDERDRVPASRTPAWFIDRMIATSTAEAAAVVADARPLEQRCPRRVTLTFVSSGNTVSRCAATTRRGRGAVARTIAEHVAGAIDANVLEAEMRELALQHLAARRFLERRRRHLAEANLIVDRLRFARSARRRARPGPWRPASARDRRRLLRGCGDSGDRTRRPATM